ncbi:unnamed protein product [Lepidochelys kempii]
MSGTQHSDLDMSILTLWPFGLCNAPATFQHFMNEVFRDILDQFMIIYLDDTLIFSENQELRDHHVRILLDGRKLVLTKSKPKKCKFDTEMVAFLGYVISLADFTVDFSKVLVITEWKAPSNMQGVK